jgi:tetraacyldisaccharide 4'-kinase
MAGSLLTNRRSPDPVGAVLERALLARWYGKPGMLLLLLPLSWLYRGVVSWRARKRSNAVPAVPVIVVGNITVGGSGKTPLVVWLVDELRKQGLKAGVISRGYGGSGPFPMLVDAFTPPTACGDEPALIARVSGAPVVVDPDRARALAYLCARGVDVVVSDDGLQHVALPRTVEIAVVDDRRRLGNGHCLPVGPLREPVARLARVDFVVGNGGDAGLGAIVMRLLPASFHAVADPQQRLSVADFVDRFGTDVTAVAGIGDPSRFFSTLQSLGFRTEDFPFPDHHAFTGAELSVLPGKVVVMTAKDAVKCRHLASASTPLWYLDVHAQLPAGFIGVVMARAGLRAAQ